MDSRPTMGFFYSFVICQKNMTDHFDEVMEYVDKATDKYISRGSSVLDHNELVLLSVWLLEAEVNNGGFNQYYWNSAGELATETVKSLNEIGAIETASIVEAANSNFPNSFPPKDREERQNLLEELENSGSLKLDSLDNEFYEYPCDLTELMYQYMLKNGLK